MSENTLISIITICYNAQDCITKTIESVIKQNYNFAEYIIIDGASTDGTIDIINKYRDKINIVISEPDHGISDAFNKGIKHAQGELICFLNAGDVFIDSTVLSTVAADWIQKKPDILFYQMRVGKTGLTPPPKYKNDPVLIWNALEVPHQACFCRKELFDEIGAFNLCIKIRMDFDFFARCKKLKRSYEYIPQVITLYDDSGISANRNNRIVFAKEALYVRKLYGLPTTLKDYLRVLKWILLSKKKG